MIEIPEAISLAKQSNECLKGKVIERVILNKSPHKFAWFSGDEKYYNDLFKGKKITKAEYYGGFLEVVATDCSFYFTDGVNLRYYENSKLAPAKHQLQVIFSDDSTIVCSIGMYGGLWGEHQFTNTYFLTAKSKPNPISQEFTFEYFKGLFNNDTQSVKAKLATNQTIPGLGNGVLQDILFNARINPRRKVNTLTSNEIENLYGSIKKTLDEMTRLNGRDTEKDLFGNAGRYVTKMSKNSLEKGCPLCNGVITKEAYLGGSVYYCDKCQK